MKRYLPIAGLIAVLLLVPLLAVSGFVYWRRGEAAGEWPSLAEEGPVEVGEPPLPDDPEAWTLILAALGGYDAANDGAQTQLEAIGLPVNSSIWAYQQVPLANLQEALARPGLRTPHRERIDDEMPDLLPLMGLARNQILRGWESAESGLMTEAVDEMLRADALGSRLVDGSQDLILIMIGLAISEIAQEELYELLTLLARQDAALHEQALAGLLANRPQSTDAAARGVAQDCRQFETMFRELGEHPERLLDEVSWDGEVQARPLQSRLAALRYDADATIAQHRRTCRATLRRMAMPPHSRDRDFEAPIQPSPAYNDIGSTLLSIASPDLTRLSDDERRAQARREGMAATLAARLHVLEHGAPPESLDDLVPDRLPAVPADPFTGKPIAYDGSMIRTEAPLDDGDILAWRVD